MYPPSRWSGTLKALDSDATSTACLWYGCGYAETGKLVDAIAAQSPYSVAAFKPVRNTKHAVIVGRTTYNILFR